MSFDLLIWLSDDPEADWGWKHGQAGGTASTLEEKAQLTDLAADKVQVIISGQCVRLFEHALPSMRDRERLSAAGFSVEDKIAAPLGEQHIVLGSGEDKRIAVISRDKMRAVLEHISNAGIHPDAMFADFDVLTQRPTPTYFTDRIVHAGRLGYTLDRDWGDGGENAHLPSVLANLNTKDALNLLQGDYAVRRSRLGSVGGVKRVAALTVCAAIAGLVLVSMHSRAIITQAEDLRAKTSTLYTQATGEPAPVNPALAVTRAARSGANTEADFLALSDILFRAVQSSPDISVDSIQFDGDEDRLVLRLIYPRFESASELEQTVAQMGGALRPGGVREQNGRLIGDAVLTRGGS